MKKDTACGGTSGQSYNISLYFYRKCKYFSLYITGASVAFSQQIKCGPKDSGNDTDSANNVSELL